MFKATKWRFMWSALALVLGLSQIFPLKDTPLDVYLLKHVKVQKEQLKQAIELAKITYQKGQEKTFFNALLAQCEKEKLDLTKCFPQYRVNDVKKLTKRNHILLQHLFKKSQCVFKQGLDLKGGVAFSLEINEKVLLGKSDHEKQQLVQKAIEVISSRIDSLGVSEPIVRPRGNRAIEVQLPGISLETNPDVVQALKKPAKLEFRLVNDSLQNHEGKLPLGYERLELNYEDEKGNEIPSSIVVKILPELTGKSIKAAHPVIDNYGKYEISLQMTEAGTKRFAKVTQQNLHKRLAIVLDGKAYSAPVIQSEIVNGQASISGRFSQREAVELANVLNNPLEFELNLVEVYEVGPSLAQSAKTVAVQASIVATIAIMVLLTVHYHWAGFVGSLALVFNFLLILAAWASIGATITLPSITALALTFGMAVDANILILERIREELVHTDLAVATQAGHKKAFITIFDSNITTLLTACLLIWLGTGPVKGFGVTLAIGILTTMFTVLVFNRFVLEYLTRKNYWSLPTKGWLTNCNVPFLNFKNYAFMISAIFITISIVATGIRGKSVLGIDFIGGEELLLSYEKPVDCQEIRDMAHSENLGEVNAVYQKYLGQKIALLKVQTEKDKGSLVLHKIQQHFPDAKMKLTAQNHMGASLSSEVQLNAILSVIAALLGILIFVALRFEFGYGLGALLALVHDTIVTIGIYIALGHQFSAPMVAAVLMLIGYSINDTIIIFDRIREELALNPVLSLKAVINLAINKTLSRTLLTSLTTFIPAAALFIFCSGIVSDYALVFLLGIIAGTFSSIFIATPIFYLWHKGDRNNLEKKQDQMPVYEWMKQ